MMGEIRGSHLSWVRLKLKDRDWQCISDSLIIVDSLELEPDKNHTVGITVTPLLLGASKDWRFIVSAFYSQPGPMSLNIWDVPRAFAAHVLFLCNSELETVKTEMKAWSDLLLNFNDDFEISHRLNSEPLGICARVLAHMVIHSLKWEPKHIFAMAHHPLFFLEFTRSSKPRVAASSGVFITAAKYEYQFMQWMKAGNKAPGPEVTFKFDSLSSLFKPHSPQYNALRTAIHKALEEKENEDWKIFYGLETGTVDSSGSQLPPFVDYRTVLTAAKSTPYHRLALFHAILPVSCYLLLLHQSLNITKIKQKSIFHHMFGLVLDLNQLEYECRLRLLTEKLTHKQYERPVVCDMEKDLTEAMAGKTVEEARKCLNDILVFWSWYNDERIEKMKQFIKMVFYFHQFRKLMAKHHLMVSAGTQKAGKSTVMKIALGCPTKAAASTNTRDGVPFSINNRLHLIDLPAYNDQCEVRNGLTRLMLHVASSAVAMIPIQNANNSPSLEFLQAIHMIRRENPYPVLILLSKADSLYDSVYEDITKSLKRRRNPQATRRRRAPPKIGPEELEQSSICFWKTVKTFVGEIKSSVPYTDLKWLALASVSPSSTTHLPKEFLSSYDDEDFWETIGKNGKQFGELENLSDRVFGIIGTMALIWHRCGEVLSDYNKDCLFAHFLHVFDKENDSLNNFFDVWAKKNL